jgi:Fe-S cluster biosynthesis and repair protein YggX
LLQEALDLEFTGGKRQALDNRVGFKDDFHNFWTGQSGVTIVLVPLVDGDALVPTAFSVEFGYYTEYLDGKKHITSLISQIKNVSTKHGDVKQAINPKDYRTLPEQTARCVSTFQNDPDLKILKDFMALGSVDDQTFQMLANDAVPTDDERKAIFLYAVKRDSCMKPILLDMAFWLNSPTNPLYQSLQDSLNQLVLALYKGELSYGNYAKIRKDNNDKFQEAHSKIIAEMKAQDAAAFVRAQHLAVEQQRLFIEQQKVHANLYKPQTLTLVPLQTIKTTTCNFYGNQMVCREM